MDHISLSRWADLILVEPATANTISKLAKGSSEDLASTVILASNKPIFLVPAMNVRMWEHPSTRENIEILKIILTKSLVQKLEKWPVENTVREK